MRGAIGIEAAQVDQRRVELAALERAEQIARVPGTRWVIWSISRPLSKFIRMASRQRAALDADAQARKIAEVRRYGGRAPLLPSTTVRAE